MRVFLCGNELGLAFVIARWLLAPNGFRPPSAETIGQMGDVIRPFSQLCAVSSSMMSASDRRVECETDVQQSPSSLIDKFMQLMFACHIAVIDGC